MAHKHTNLPDYDYWKKADAWTLEEGCSLVFGEEPEEDSWIWHIFHYDKVLSRDDIGRLYHLAKKRFQSEEKFGVRPVTFLQWCASINVSIPEPLTCLLDAKADDRTLMEQAGKAASESHVSATAPKAGTVRTETNSGLVDWKTIRMRFSDDNPYVVLVARKGEKQKRVTAAELGLSDRRTGNLPNAQWALLKRFAEAPNKHIVPEVREAAAFKRAVSRLNRALTTAFGASNNPIVSLSKMHEREPWGKPKAGCGWHCLIDIA